jgi:Tol biopolymer transport system component
VGSWSPDGARLAFCLGAPYFEIWAADLDPKLPTPETLGPSQTCEEHFREMVSHYTRRIEADPCDAYAYSSRARYYDYLHNREKAEADMRQSAAILSGLSSAELPSASMGFTFGTPIDFKTIVPHFKANDWIECFSADGLEVYFASYRSGGRGQGSHDLWVMTHTAVDANWGPPQNLGPAVNSSARDRLATLSADGLTLYFMSARPGGCGSADIYKTTRASRSAPWEPAVNLGPAVNSADQEENPWITRDDLQLYFGSKRSDGYGGWDIYVTSRVTPNDPWGEPVNLGPAVNSAYGERCFSLSPDGLRLVFSDDPDSPWPRPGGYGYSDIWITRRASPSDPWQIPVNLGPPINGPNVDLLPRFSADGRTLYYVSCSNHTDYYLNGQAPLIPVAEANGAGP